jgi:transcriptional regulator with XRE-family HTH domain
MAAFGETLKTLREKAGLSQRELAHKAGLTRDAVSSLEQGRRQPAWDTVQALCRALGVSSEVFRDDAPSAGGK